MAREAIGLQFFAEGLEIGLVLRAPCYSLVSDQGFSTYQLKASIVHLAFNPARPRLVEGHSCKRSEKVDAVRGNAQLNHPIRVSEIRSF